MYQGFADDIKKFNEIYKLPSHDNPVLPTKERIGNFIDILKEELEEGHDIIAKYSEGADGGTDQLAVMTELGDWLGDIIVYAASEARRAGIPLPEILQVIMASNFSKLGADGQPIYDERGKVLKGPDYWRPEERIAAVIAAKASLQ